MLQSDLVSVVMPVYNGQAFLKEAVDSILNQSYTNIECIVINDGSNDSTLAILKSYSDTRLKVISFDTNQGLISALNAGLQAAGGDYIARMDADDIAHPKRIEKQLNCFKANTMLLACDSDYYNLQEATKKLSTSNYTGDTLKGMLIFTTCFCHPAVMMRNVFSAHALTYNADYTHVEDYKLWCDLAQLGEFAHLSEPLLQYRSHSKQVSNQHHQLQLQKSSQIRSEYLSQLGFEVSKEQLAVIDVVGNNEFIRSKELLEGIEKTLLHLKSENKHRQVLSQLQFQLCLHKFWFDSCGFSNLGTAAFRMYLNSELSSGKRNLALLLRLWLKCFVRRNRQ